MNWLDYVFLVIVLVYAMHGLSRGFSRVVVGLVATVAGLLIACWTYGVAASYLMPYTSSRSVANVLGFLIIFIAIQILGAIIGKILHKIFKATGLGWLDRLLGLGFGALKAVVLGIILVLILTAFPVKAVPESVVHSRLAPYLIDAANAVSFVAPRELRDGFAESSQRLRELWKKSLQSPPKEQLKTDKY